TATARRGGDWTRFGYDAARRNFGPASTGITAANVGHLKRQQVRLPGTVDASPIYLRGVVVHGKRHDVFFVTTTYGITLAVGACSRQQAATSAMRRPTRGTWRRSPPRGDGSCISGTRSAATATP